MRIEDGKLASLKYLQHQAKAEIDFDGVGVFLRDHDLLEASSSSVTRSITFQLVETLIFY